MNIKNEIHSLLLKNRPNLKTNSWKTYLSCLYTLYTNLAKPGEQSDEKIYISLLMIKTKLLIILKIFILINGKLIYQHYTL